MTGPTISVIVPLYQTAAHIGAALDSALTQSFEDLEVIVVDDGSTDGSLEVASEYAARDRRVTVIRQLHCGSGAARNVALAAAVGQFVAFLDSDDLWLEDKLERQRPWLREGVVVHADARILLESRELREERYHDLNPVALDAHPFEAMLVRNQVALLTAVVSRSLVIEHGGFDPLLSPCEDYDLWLRLATADVEFIYVPESLAVYRMRVGSNSADPVRNTTSRLAMFRKVESAVGPDRRRAVRARVNVERRLLAGELMVRGWRTAIDGQLPTARRDLNRALRVAPRWWRPAVVALAAWLPLGLWRCAAPCIPRQRVGKLSTTA